MLIKNVFTFEKLDPGKSDKGFITAMQCTSNCPNISVCYITFLDVILNIVFTVCKVHINKHFIWRYVDICKKIC